MLDTLKFVRGAVSTKDLVPVLTHFCVSGGRLQGQNGRLTLDAACPDLAHLELAVPADKFLRAVDACDGEPKLTVKDDMMTVSRGRFRAKMGVQDVAAYPRVERLVDPDPDHARGGAGLVAMLRRALPFISTDASRPWSCSVYITESVSYATNNVVLACFDYAWGKEDLVLPVFCVHELIRIGEDPVSLAWDDTHFVAEYADGSWLSSLLVDGGWPTTLFDLYKTAVAAAEDADPMPGDMLDALEKLKPFFPDAKQPVVLLGEEGVSTQEGVTSALVGMDGLPKAAFRLESLTLVAETATHWDPARWPGAVPWFGEGVVGMLSGVRV